MASDNRISIEISQEKKDEIEDAVQALKAALKGITINLTKEERRSLPKIADKTLAFDEKCRTYMAARPELVPGFIDHDEMALDRKLIADLLPFFRELEPICEGLKDTISLAYTDVYMADLSFHQSVKVAAKRGVSGADTIYDDLRTRFPVRKKGDTGPATAP